METATLMEAIGEVIAAQLEEKRVQPPSQDLEANLNL